MLNSILGGEMSMVIIIFLIGLIVMIPLSALALFFSCKIFKREVSYAKSLIPAAIMSVFSLAPNFVSGLPEVFIENPSLMIILGITIFVFTIGLYLVLPKLIFGFEWKRGLLIGLVWFGFMFVIEYVFSIIFFGLFGSLM